MRTRSHWAWGFEDGLPPPQKRLELAQRVAFLLGEGEIAERAPIEAVALRDVQLPPPRVAPTNEVRSFARTDPEARVRATYGRALPDIVRGFRGDFASAPDLVLAPRSDAEVEAALAYAVRERVMCVPRGGGTSVVGGVEAADDARFAGRCVLDLSEMSALLELDAASRRARFQAGILGPALEDALRPHGLTLRHYPQSYEHSTLGGWIATRAGGHYATGPTRVDDFVEAARMCTPAGWVETREVPSTGAGPNPLGLLLGSEGAWGVITDAWVRVRERPRWRASASVGFESFQEGAEAVRVIVQAGLAPASARLLDPVECALASVASEGRATLLLGFESPDQPTESSMERALDLAEGAGGSCKGGPRYRVETKEEGGESYRRAFFDGPYLQSALVTLGVTCDTFETACTWSAHEGLQRAVRDAFERVTGELGRRGALACRFTHAYPDGPAPYFTWLLATRRGEELEAWAKVKAAVTEALFAAGGTVTHHHAVGRTHQPWYLRELRPTATAAMHAVKGALDPSGVMNPGCLLPQ